MASRMIPTVTGSNVGLDINTILTSGSTDNAATMVPSGHLKRESMSIGNASA